jgi:hypothetical protein
VVYVYQSQFGQERLILEEHEGPPANIFKTQSGEYNNREGQITVDYDEETLRKYQLERMRSASTVLYLSIFQ